METISDIAKILDSETVQKIYEDGLSKPIKQIGALGEDFIKALRLFTAPIQLLASYQDRLRGYLDDVRNRVPQEKQTEAPAHVAGPVLLNLRFIEEDNILKELYLNLLAAAIDKDRQQRAHPGFIKIIEQLSPEEALILYEMKRDSGRECYYAIGSATTGVVDSLPITSCGGGYEYNEVSHPHLESLHIIEIVSEKDQNGMPKNEGIKATPYGRAFIDVCIPDKVDLQEQK